MLDAIALFILVYNSSFEEANMKNTLKHSDVAFMYTAEPEIYKAYNATWVAWGGASADAVKKAQALGIHYAASMWLLTAGAENIHKRADLRDAVSKDIILEPIIVPWLWDHTYEGTPSYFGCTNNPVFREFSKERVASAIKTGADGLHIDDHLGSAGSFWSGGCFCDFCVSGFREFLKSGNYEDEVKKHNINLDDFNYRDFLKAKVSTRDEYKNQRGKIPLVDIFHTFQVKSAAAFVAELRKLAETVKGSPITCSANTGIPNPAHLVVTPNLTHCVCEVEFRHGNKNAPEVSPIAAFKVGDAINRPIAATASGWNWAYAIENENAVGLVRLWIAESYALGHRLMAPHRKWAFTAEKGTHWYQSKPEDFAYLYQFIRKNAELLDGYEPYSQIGLVFCNKSARRYGYGKFQEICKVLADSNRQFSAIIAGDDWLEDRLTIENLKKYDVIIVPEPNDLNDLQKKVLKEWETLKSRQVNYVSSADEIKAINFPESPVKFSGSDNVWVLPRINPGKPLVCHILNRNYDENTKKVTPVKNVKVILGKPLFDGINIPSCKLLSPGNEPERLDAKVINGELHINIPELGIWSILLL